MGGGGARPAPTVPRHGRRRRRRARPAPARRLAAERDTAARRRLAGRVVGDLLQRMFFDAAVLDVGGEVAVAARAPVGSTAAAVPAAVAAAGAHATTETVRHEAVDDRVGAALHVRQQVRSQLPTHTHTHTHTAK